MNQTRAAFREVSLQHFKMSLKVFSTSRLDSSWYFVTWMNRFYIEGKGSQVKQTFSFEVSMEMEKTWRKPAKVWKCSDQTAHIIGLAGKLELDWLTGRFLAESKKTTSSAADRPSLALVRSAWILINACDWKQNTMVLQWSDLRRSHTNQLGRENSYLIQLGRCGQWR